MIAVAIAALLLAAGIVVFALRLVVTERDSFRLERVGRLERHHAQMSALIAEHAATVNDMLRVQHEERSILMSEHRSDMRELLNRVQHPQLVPTATRPVAPPREQNASEKARAAWGRIGRAAPPRPADDVGDDVP